ncbi:MAG TPA: hypothetical protein GX517_11950 [Alicyclobacillus sp.]|nr:hypothetical protein [Alicyclobacillus sp.]
MEIGDKVRVVQSRKQQQKKVTRPATVVHVANRWVTVDYGRYRESVWLDDVVMVLEGRKRA